MRKEEKKRHQILFVFFNSQLIYTLDIVDHLHQTLKFQKQKQDKVKVVQDYLDI
jgi:hypothetical protein